MKKNRIFLLLCCALLPALLRAQAPQERESILIISSYNPDTRRMSGFIAEFERNIMASGIPCDIYVETLECKSINDAPIWMSQTENMISRYENKGLRAIVVNNSEMLLTLLNDILDISSLECGKIKFNCSSEEIVQVCQHVLMTTAHTRQEGVEGRLECAVGSYMLVTDVHRLSQILINLLTNAGKFTSQGSITLGVEIDEAHREVLFSVADTGPGIPLDKQEMVFNRFEKLDGNKKKGTGLGLAICRQIAMIFGGRIWVDPTYTAGARFVFAHPIDIRFPEDGENRGGVSPLEAPGSSR